ncbi:MAG: hypothetical protein CMB38_04455 [Euryarchaeota archaeon]|nr:hypothetical protein [Euryarchaeota archaeon]DAC35876.1 MAG TPA: TM2 domain-containing protein [Candidatus Poseidoniales archaeon]
MTEGGGVQASPSAVQGTASNEQPLLQDSAVAGNVHVGDVVHQYHVAAPVAPAVAPAASVGTPAYAQHAPVQPVRHPGERDLIEAYILCLFLGWFGGHRFYFRQPGLGVLYFLTFGIFGLGVIADMIRMPYMVQRYNLQRFPR